MLKNERGYYYTNNDWLVALGFPPNGHWPDAGFTRIVDGVTVRLTDKPVRHNARGEVVKSSKHRLFYRCPLCDGEVWVPCGRAQQHKHRQFPAVDDDGHRVEGSQAHFDRYVAGDR